MCSCWNTAATWPELNRSLALGQRDYLATDVAVCEACER